MSDYLNFNGNLFLEHEMHFGLNRAMRFGDGVFETIRVKNGELVWWHEHFERLRLGIRLLKMKVPDLFFDELLVDCLATLHRNGVKQGGILRILLYRKGGAGYTPTAYDFNYLIETEKLSSNQFELNKKGLKVDVSEEVTLQDTYHPIKSLNKLPYVLASAEKAHRGMDELILMNKAKYIVEATSSNLFMVKNGIIYTPQERDGLLMGVTRKKVIEFAKELQTKIVEKSLTLNDLEMSDEVFLTNSISGVRWIGAYKNQRYLHHISDLMIDKMNNG